ncbi:methyltransferase family protein [Haloactinopolyspora alba]|uniref:Methyltransferase family protein n=1 Tax=Haloactinopolyspora alba TaxID=648780 RepID=A0A2P8DFY1_9ACTN|nr:class I SAM-dependent methyltransferase [Haloactinopolyspora alba]PSK96111.1 methyltransferase family protein [Haloactinopolyspora alba]
MSDPTPAHRLYDDLAPWWPLISPADDYAEEARFAASVLRSASRPVHDVLELGSGGGSNAGHLSASFTMTLVDLSEPMLAVSRALNPDCTHVAGDMRTIRLGRDFDAVFVHDAVGYMITEDDLARVVATTYAHCRPGGAAVFVPDVTTETFRERSEHGGGDGPDGAAARYLEWGWDPDPDDTWIRSDYVFVLRDAQGSVQVVHDTHRIGLFGRDVWLRLLHEAGFDALVLSEQTDDDRVPRDVFVGHRPA